MISVFEFINGEFSLNVWGIALVFMLLIALASRGARS